MAGGGVYLDVATSDIAEPRRQVPRRPAVLIAAAALGSAAFVGGALVVDVSHTARRVAFKTLGVTGLDALQPRKQANLKPLELLHDGNVCDVNEELLAGLCYKKCALLTNYEAMIRTSPWTCCPHHPCTPLNEKGKIGLRIMCTGYDIGGDGGCPHEPGACLVDEELHGGVCYEKCALLTHGAFPNRMGPATCCDVHGLGCLSPGHAVTNKTFDVGGGEGDHGLAALAGPHFPQLSLTEDANSKQPRTPAKAQAQASAQQDAPLRIALQPLEAMDDGNICADNEELYGGLCYKRCAILTGGEASIRTSSWTCCKEHPCLPWNQHGSVGSRLVCNGYDIDGDGSCPHKPGACLVDEELHMGICYKKCSLLTRGLYPHRTAAATCCKSAGLSCLNLGNDRTSRSFDVGGGAGDHDASTPAKPHPPLQRLTEKAADAEGASAPQVELHRRLRSGGSA
eukprot:CAMPEP_0176040720 /NCGR_PEP_ID=MMETSP0120_2-20121206/20194_1 /TAXON_ID=160619 /ORGANISM="Kryptoperidinium foliaceum, Strain CCMP 1326" /LENGTH=453 /DNA_ID=CAMNT_0017374121 /DNA_START=37 /DNA_END=1398 /DNA_ORIENTATION=-